jgi:hypothetical protein
MQGNPHIFGPFNHPVPVGQRCCYDAVDLDSVQQISDPVYKSRCGTFVKYFHR